MRDIAGAIEKRNTHEKPTRPLPLQEGTAVTFISDDTLRDSRLFTARPLLRFSV
jgi:hypothetical protein